MFWIFFFQRKKKHLPGRCCCRVRLFAAMDTPHICTTPWYRLVTYADVPIASGEARGKWRGCKNKEATARTLCYLASKWQHGWWFGPCCSHLSGIPINPLPQLPCNCNQPSERLRRLHKSFQASHLYSPLTKTRMVMDMRHGRTQLIRSNQRWPESERNTCVVVQELCSWLSHHPTQ